MISSNRQIVGIFLIKNEDIFIRQAILNVVFFCDRILIADNFSTDHTWNIVKELEKTYSHIECHRIKRTQESHEMIKKYAGTNTWVLGVDGDEIYDPYGLNVFRQELLGGKWDNWWVIFGNVLNCINLDVLTMKAEGYLAPPCRSMTKLYNFNAIEQWEGCCPERLHGGNPIFNPGYNVSLRLALNQKMSWNESKFRCLHTCFLKRSSLDPFEMIGRPNPPELRARGLLERIGLGFLALFYRSKPISYKRDKYLIGNIVTKNVSTFFHSCPE